MFALKNLSPQKISVDEKRLRGRLKQLATRLGVEVVFDSRLKLRERLEQVYASPKVFVVKTRKGNYLAVFRTGHAGLLLGNEPPSTFTTSFSGFQAATPLLAELLSKGILDVLSLEAWKEEFASVASVEFLLGRHNL